jgi:hypothetical protein
MRLRIPISWEIKEDGHDELQKCEAVLELASEEIKASSEGNRNKIQTRL